MDIVAYRDYLDHFNNRRYDEFCAYYDEDVVFELPGWGTLRSRDAIRDFYLGVHRDVTEALHLEYFVSDRNRLAAELYTEFTCVAESATLRERHLARGEQVRFSSFVHYDLRDGRFAQIRAVRWKEHR